MVLAQRDVVDGEETNDGPNEFHCRAALAEITLDGGDRGPTLAAIWRLLSGPGVDIP